MEGGARPCARVCVWGRGGGACVLLICACVWKGCGAWGQGAAQATQRTQAARAAAAQRSASNAKHRAQQQRGAPVASLASSPSSRNSDSPASTVAISAARASSSRLNSAQCGGGVEGVRRRRVTEWGGAREPACKVGDATHNPAPRPSPPSLAPAASSAISSLDPRRPKDTFLSTWKGRTAGEGEGCSAGGGHTRGARRRGPRTCQDSPASHPPTHAHTARTLPPPTMSSASSSRAL